MAPPPRLYLTDEDAKIYKSLLERRTEQLKNAHVLIMALAATALFLLGMLILVLP